MAALLRREERLEHASARRLVHAGARVLDLDEHPPSGPHRRALRLVPARVDLAHPAQTHGDSTGLVAEGVRGVGEQVHDDLAQRDPIAHDHGRRVDGQLELRLLRQRRGEQRPQLTHELPEVDGLAPAEVPLPRVGQHLSRERRGPLRGRDDGRRDLLVLVRRGAIAQELGVAEHARQQVVEVVRDAARQHAQAVEPLRALDLLLEPAPLGLEALRPLACRAHPPRAPAGRRASPAPRRPAWAPGFPRRRWR